MNIDHIQNLFFELFLKLNLHIFFLKCFLIDHIQKFQNKNFDHYDVLFYVIYLNYHKNFLVFILELLKFKVKKGVEIV